MGIVARSQHDEGDNPRLAAVEATYAFDCTDLADVAHNARRVSEVMGARTDA